MKLALVLSVFAGLALFSDSNGSTFMKSIKLPCSSFGRDVENSLRNLDTQADFLVLLFDMDNHLCVFPFPLFSCLSLWTKSLITSRLRAFMVFCYY